MNAIMSRRKSIRLTATQLVRLILMLCIVILGVVFHIGEQHLHVLLVQVQPSSSPPTIPPDETTQHQHRVDVPLHAEEEEGRWLLRQVNESISNLGPTPESNTTATEVHVKAMVSSSTSIVTRFFFPGSIPPVSSNRSERFPSVAERVKVYAGNWYLPPCHNHSDTLPVWHIVSNASTSSEGDSTVQVFHETVEIADWTFYNYITADQIFVWTPLVAGDLCMSAKKSKKSLTKHTNGKGTVTGTATTINKLNVDVIEDGDGSDGAGEADDAPSNDISKRLPSFLDYPVELQRLMDPATASAMTKYCSDVLEWKEMPSAAGIDDSNIPLLVQFGDLKYSHVYNELDIPHFKKFRSAIVRDDQSIARTTGNTITGNIIHERRICQSERDRPPLHTFHSTTRMQPLIWKLATSRHYKHLDVVLKDDIPWEEKRSMAVFRGQMTGVRDTTYNETLSDYENCQRFPRCKLVYDHHQSTWVDAKLTSTRRWMRIPNNVTPGNVNLLTRKQPPRELMKYKAIIMLEGNDVASGLKWALLSQSVVLMPTPKYTSWAMEESLVQWKHYIPLEADDLSDVEEKMKWIDAHDIESQRIAQHGTQWMMDLCFHPDSQREERLIKEELLRRYAQHFRIVQPRLKGSSREQVSIKKSPPSPRPTSLAPTVPPSPFPLNRNDSHKFKGMHVKKKPSPSPTKRKPKKPKPSLHPMKKPTKPRKKLTKPGSSATSKSAPVQ